VSCEKSNFTEKLFLSGLRFSVHNDDCVLSHFRQIHQLDRITKPLPLRNFLGRILQRPLRLPSIRQRQLGILLLVVGRQDRVGHRRIGILLRNLSACDGSKY